MANIVIIGAGSGFGGKLTLDIVACEALKESTITLVDINTERLNAVQTYLKRVIATHKLPTRIEATTDRRKALKGAEFIVTAISVGGAAYSGEPYESEKGIPYKYGISQRVADTIGPGGVFRFLRTGPVQLEFCRDIEELCPKALLLNYTNPMCMLSWMHSMGSKVANVGLCHSVQHTAQALARYVGVPEHEVRYLVAGINHFAFFLKLEHNGQDLYPRLREAMANPETFERDAVRFEMMKHFGLFITESSGHLSEYLPYFRRTTELQERFGLPHFRTKDRPGKGREWLTNPTGVEIPALKASEEYASGIINAVVTNKPFAFNGNVTNTNLIPNLPQGCCVEVPCLVDSNGVQPTYVGNLPEQCAALNRTNVSVQELAVKAVLNKDREAAFHAVALDPLTAGVLPLDQIRKMFEEMWAAEKHLLTWFDK